jgi:hypothetical protein
MEDDLLFNIDDAAFKLVVELDIKPAPTPNQTEKSLYGIPTLVNLGEITSFSINSEDGWGNTNSRFLNEGGKLIGFGQEKYKQVRKITSAFLEIDDRYLIADAEFIEKEIFEWVIAIYKTQKAELGLTAYLEKRLNEETKDYTFYFKLGPLGINEAFTFGWLRILPFTEELILKEFQQLPPERNITWEKYKDGFKDILDTIVVEITVKAVESKADEVARADAALIINAFKCYFNAESLSLSYQLFDLDFKATVTGFSRSVIKYNEQGGLRFNIKRLNGTLPIELTVEVLDRLKKDGLDYMHEFLLARKNSEFYLLLLQAIEQYGTVVSTRNLHERMVNLVSFFELFLNDENSSRSKAETFLKSNVLPTLMVPDDLERGKTLIRLMYHIRDKYLHNRILIILDVEELLRMQIIALGFLKRMMKLSKTITTKDEFFDHFQIPH